jgi:LPS-assembly lipoprotein
MRFLSFIALILLTACGFTPMYGSSGNTHQVQSALHEVYVDIIPDSEGQYLRNALIDRFHSAGTPQNPRYRLSVSPVSETRTELDVTETSDTTRAELRLNISMVLKDSSGQILGSRSLTSSASYNVLASQFTTRVSEENARRNVLDDLARQAEQQVVLILKQR